MARRHFDSIEPKVARRPLPSDSIDLEVDLGRVRVHSNALHAHTLLVSATATCALVAERSWHSLWCCYRYKSSRRFDHKLCQDRSGWMSIPALSNFRQIKHQFTDLRALFLSALPQIEAFC